MMDKTAQESGKRIRRYRKANGLTQAALAEKAGIESNTVARLERGEHQPAGPTLEKLAKALGVKSSDLLPY